MIQILRVIQRATMMERGEIRMNYRHLHDSIFYIKLMVIKPWIIPRIMLLINYSKIYLINIYNPLVLFTTRWNLQKNYFFVIFSVQFHLNCILKFTLHSSLCSYNTGTSKKETEINFLGVLGEAGDLRHYKIMNRLLEMLSSTLRWRFHSSVNLTFVYVWKCTTVDWNHFLGQIFTQML